jgi:hypothetical protein
MITIEKLKIYQHFRGDVDGWVRTGSEKDKYIIKNTDWFLIDSLIQDIFLIRKDLVAKSFKTKMINNINTNCENDSTVRVLFSLEEFLNE